MSGANQTDAAAKSARTASASGSAGDMRSAGAGRRRVWLALAGLGLLLIAAILAFLLWLMNTQQGARWAAGLAAGMLDEQLSVQVRSGTLAGPLTLERLAYRDRRSGLAVAIEQVDLDLRWLALLRGVLQLDDALLRGVRVVLGEAQPSAAAAESTPFFLRPPIDIVVDRFRVENAVVRSPAGAPAPPTSPSAKSVPTGAPSPASPPRPSPQWLAMAGPAAGRASAEPPAPLIELIRAELAGEWTKAGIVLRRLDVLATQGEAHLTGRVAQRGREAGEGRGTMAKRRRATMAGHGVYQGEAQGRFHWRIGEQRLAGELRARTRQERADLALQLSAPLAARLEASLRQAEDWPWQFALEVPSFDPRKNVLPDSGMQRLAASLRGAGSLASGELQGTIDVDGVPIHIEPLRFTRDEREITLDPLRIRLGGAPDERSAASGTLIASGVLSTSPTLKASVELEWQDLQIPPQWAGQRLHSQGRLQLQGSMDSYVARGRLQIGPPRAPADIAIDVAGSSTAIELEQLAVLQAGGELTARGRVALEPLIGWHLAAQARTFDPGALVAGWPGRVSFRLETEGSMEERGAGGRLLLRDLRGSLRGRPLEGRADVNFSGLSAAGQPSLAGGMVLRSGDSRIELRAGPAAVPGTLRASAQLDVRSLDDWLPDAQGRLRARLEAHGTWPALDVELAAQGQALRLAQLRSDALDVQLEVHDLSKPSGKARIDLSGVGAAGLKFSGLRLRADGDQAAHRLALTASGERLGGDLKVSGAQSGAGWSGSIERLRLDVPEVARLSLEAPAALRIGARGAMELQQACLSGDEMRLCTSLTRQEDGALEASYVLERVQLALANALVPALPVAVSGTIEGRGDLRRTAQGELFGRAGIELPGGRITPVQQSEGARSEETLLEYSQLHLRAGLDGTVAQAMLSGRLGGIAEDGLDGGSGMLDGRVALRGLGQPARDIEGELSASIPSLAPLASFVPQLAEVAGRATLRLSVAGTLDAPRLSGELQASELAAQIPDLGLKLTAGRVRAVPHADGVIDLDGEIHSGTGALAFAGRMASGRFQATVKGRDFLAADIPAARVIVAPELAFVRDEQHMRLTGEVSVARADIDLSRLPAGSAGGQRGSADVVVIDDENAIEEAQAVPLQADVTIVLGDAVKLTGFGLDATLQGRLGIQERPAAATKGTGNIRLAGTYQAYGQDLNIQRGQLLYADTPLDDPGLDIVAVRKVEQITAGLRVEGTARNPRLSVFSTPAMAQSEALAYLVTGRSLEQMGGGADADVLQGAARSLGAAGGGLLAKSIGGRLGIDDVGVENNDMVGGAAFTVGQYLSPRLYLSYGVGLFTPGEVITLRYRLSRTLSLQTARGSSETRAGIDYRIEK